MNIENEKTVKEELELIKWGELGSRFKRVKEGIIFISQTRVAISYDSVVKLLESKLETTSTIDDNGFNNWVIKAENEKEGEVYQILLATMQVESGCELKLLLWQKEPAAIKITDGVEQLIEKLIKILGLPAPTEQGGQKIADKALFEAFSNHRYLRVLALGGSATVLLLSIAGGRFLRCSDYHGAIRYLLPCTLYKK